MAVSSTIAIKLDAQTATLKKGFNEASQATRGLSNQIKTSLGSGIMKLNAALQVTQMALGAVSGTIRNIMESLNRVAGLGDFADRIGESAEALQRLQWVVEDFGATAPVLNTALQRMARRIADAAANGGPLADRLDRLNMSVRDLSALSPTEQFAAMAGAISKMDNSGEQMALTMALMDTEGVALVETLRQGEQAVKDMMAAVGEHNLMTEEQVKAAQATAAATNRMSKSWQAFKDRLIVSVAPALEKIFDFIANKIIPAMEKLWQFMKRFPVTGIGLIGRALDEYNSGIDYTVEEKTREAVERIQKATVKKADKAIKPIKEAIAQLKTLGGAGAVTSTSAAGFSAYQSGRRMADETFRYYRESIRLGQRQLAVAVDTSETLEAVLEPVGL